MGQRPTKSHGFIKWKIYVRYQQERIDPPSGENPPIMMSGERQ